VVCDLCEETSSPATKRCTTDNIALCESHVKIHQKRKPDHEISALGETPLQCAEHGQSFSFYCKHDRQVICPTCDRLHHVGHQVITIKDAMVFESVRIQKDMKDAKSLISTLNTVLDNCSELQSRLTQAQGIAELDVNKHFEAISMAVDARRQMLIEDIQSTSGKGLSILEQHTEEITADVSEILGRLQVLSESVQNESGCAMLFAQKKLEKCLSEFTEPIVSKKQNPRASASLTFRAELKKDLGMINGIGQCTTDRKKPNAAFADEVKSERIASPKRTHWSEHGRYLVPMREVSRIRFWSGRFVDAIEFEMIDGNIMKIGGSGGESSGWITLPITIQQKCGALLDSVYCKENQLKCGGPGGDRKSEICLRGNGLCVVQVSISNGSAILAEIKYQE